MKKFIFSSALLMALAAVSFAGNPKESKIAIDPTEAKSKTTDEPMLYWYQVTYDASHTQGYIPSGTSLFAHDEKSSVESPCEPGETIDCLRGFPNPLNGSQSTSVGDDQIKKD